VQILRGFSRTFETKPPKVILFEQNDDKRQSIPLLKSRAYSIYTVGKTLIRLKLQPVSSWSAAYHDYVAITCP
jgi:hypothetical protein